MQTSGTGPGTAGVRGLWWWTMGALGAVLAWDASGLDLALARLMAAGGGFALREHWLLTAVLHDGARKAAWLLGLWLLAGLWWPIGVLRSVTRRRRMQWLASTAISLLFIGTLKYASHSSCPWDLSAFGGAVEYLSHWTWGGSDGGPGRCFPAGHASAGFAFVGGYFVLRTAARAKAVQCLAIALSAGMLLGLAQQLRGAHFMSHTLWTAWFCWAIAAGVDAVAAQLGSPQERATGHGVA